MLQKVKKKRKNMNLISHYSPGPNKGKQLSVDALMDSYLKPSALKPNPQPQSWFSASTGNAASAAGSAPQNAVPNSPTDLGGFQSWQDKDVPENYLQVYQV